jgi:dephospho-CoA kinase
MLKVGLTGVIGSGKSYVSRIFSALGISVYPADQKAKILINSNKNLKDQIINEFGSDSFIENNYNTKYISALVFQNTQLLARLNQIVHPYVIDDFLCWCSKHEKENYILHESAILFESKLSSMFDYSIVVDSPEELRIQRVIKRDHTNRENVLYRMKNQLSAVELISLTDWVIENDDKNLILPQILTLHTNLTRISLSHG